MNNTLQRKEILKIMQTTPGHFSADELYTVLRKKIPQISLATVYRNLELLSSVGKLQKIKSIIPQKHFESNCTSHFHVHCPVCGKIEDIYYDSAREIEEYINKLTEKLNFDSCHLEFISVCSKCREKISQQNENKPPKKEPLSML